MTTVGRALQQAGFGRPRGLFGRFGGWLMARGNAATELRMVELADLHEPDVVLVLGPGPGIGLRAAGERSAHVIGVDPSDLMLATCQRRCADLVRPGRVRLRRGTAEHTGQPDQSVDVVLAVNNVFLWPDWHAGLTELHRVLCPGGRLLLSTHEKWLPGGLPALKAAVEAAGFGNVQTWTWQPPGRGAISAAQLQAERPAG